jgi:hypothetical protein
MSLKIEIADWRLEFDLRGMTATPIDRAAKTRSNQNSGSRRGEARRKPAIGQSIVPAISEENNQYQRKTGGKKQWA